MWVDLNVEKSGDGSTREKAFKTLREAIDNITYDDHIIFHTPPVITDPILIEQSGIRIIGIK